MNEPKGVNDERVAEKRQTALEMLYGRGAKMFDEGRVLIVGSETDTDNSTYRKLIPTDPRE